MKKLLLLGLVMSMSAFGATDTLTINGTPTEGLDLDCTVQSLEMGTYSYANGASDAEDDSFERIGAGELAGTRGQCNISGSAGLSVNISVDASATLDDGLGSTVTVNLSTEDAAGAAAASVTLDGFGGGSFHIDGQIAGSDAGTTTMDVNHTGTATVTAVYP